MAEALLEVVLEPVLHYLSSLIWKEVGSLLGVDQEMRKLSSILTTIHAVLEDAEEKQLTDKHIKNWLQKLKDAAQVVDEILDECATEAIDLEYQANKCKKTFLSCFGCKHVLFRRKIAKKMEDISRKLDEIAAEKSKFHLDQTVITRGAEAMRRRETTSFIKEAQVYGRKEEKEKIVDYLIGQASNFEDLSVYPIVGMGGLGKTTLAKLIFNDKRVAKHFESRIWVCVSEEFDLRRILKGILGSATANACDGMELEPLGKKVQDLVKRKKYLLVLDDVWNENSEEWENLKSVVNCGSKGASIIVTTRLKQVASIMGTISPCQLLVLSDDDCWELFKYRAFEPGEDEPEELVAIGKEIVKKCGGVPLAAKALGSLLRFKRKETEWLSIEEDIPWSSTQENVMSILRLSYSNLPVKLRRCFAFCAIFPKDHKISKHILIELWMANGFISSNGKLEVEDVGDEVWNELCWRSFFQDIKIDELGETSFKMHDLIHDLAQDVVAEEVCCINGSNGFTNLSERTHHLSINTSISANECNILHLPRVKFLRTCIMPEGDHDRCLPNLLKCYSLRVFQGCLTNELSSSVGHLRHLRYLNLSGSKFEMLPKSICSLWNLQILNLNDCDNLQRLPNSLTRLRVLRHLHLIGCYSLSSLPSGIGQLTCLKTLNVYIVDKKKGFLLAELEHLNLGGELDIQHLEKVRSVMDAKKANMVNKNLDHLELSWRNNGESESQGNVEQILEALEPHPQLKYLKVTGYGGIHFPQWMGSATFKYLYEVELWNCDNCLQLPSLGKLPSLKRLIIWDMNKVRYVDEESYIGGAATGFKALEYLSLFRLPNLERLSKEDGQNIFPRLSHVKIDVCPKLLALPCLLSLGNLEISKLRNLTSLEELLISGCDSILRNALEYLTIASCDSLELITEQTWQGLHSLKTLEIRNCPKLKLSDGFQYLTSLQSLNLMHLENLASLPDCFGSLSNLCYLFIYNCPKLMCLPISIQGLCNLKGLSIMGCPELKKRCEKETGEDWHKIAHVPNVHVGPLITRRGSMTLQT